MKLQLHAAKFFFFEGDKHYEVFYAVFEDNTYSIFVFLCNDKDEKIRNIGTFDTIIEPTVSSAKDFLIRAITT